MVAVSATYPEFLANALAKYMRDPTFVRLNSSDPSLLGESRYWILTLLVCDALEFFFVPSCLLLLYVLLGVAANGVLTDGSWLLHRFEAVLQSCQSVSFGP